MDENFRKLFEQQNRFRKLLEDAMGPTEKLRRQIDTLLEPSPALRAIQEMMAGFQADPARRKLMEEAERIRQLGEPLRRQAESMARLGESFGLGDANTRTILQEMSDAMRSRQSAGPPLGRIVEPAISSIRYLEPPTREREPSDAERMIQTIVASFEAEKAEKQDPRHTVYIMIYLPSGAQVVVDRLTEDAGGQIIHIEGVNPATQEHIVAKVGALGFQYDFFVVEHRPKLYVVDGDGPEPDSDDQA